MKAQRIQSTVVVSWLEDLYVKYVFDCAIAPLQRRQALYPTILGLDARRGFEPRLTESESVVLPLDDRAARGVRISDTGSRGQGCSNALQRVFEPLASTSSPDAIARSAE